MTLEEEFFKWKTNQVTTKQLLDWLSQLQTKIETINERTKQHTLDIRELRKTKKD